MKVTQKLRRGSSISRIILRKNKMVSTQVAGNREKHGKRFQVRGQTRVRTSTHKRGVRFHRKSVLYTVKYSGGTPPAPPAPLINCSVWTKKDLDDEMKKKFIVSKLGISQAVVSNVKLFYKKNGTVALKPFSATFNVTLIVYNSPNCTSPVYSYVPSFDAVFTRTTTSDGKKVEFHITRLGDFTADASLKKLVSMYNDSAYDFYFKQNVDVFKQIQSCIKAKLLDVYKNLYELLELGLKWKCVVSNETNKIKCSPPTSTPQAPVESVEPVAPVAPVAPSDLDKFLDIISSITTRTDDLTKRAHLKNQVMQTDVIVNNIRSNIDRLKRMARNIINLLEIRKPISDSVSDEEFSRKLYENNVNNLKNLKNLEIALTFFISVYSRIIYDTAADKPGNDHYVEEPEIRI